MVGIKQKQLSISQDDFDEAVKSNREDLGLEEDEALSAAIEEFKIQGVELAGIITDPNGERPPIVDLCTRLSAAVLDNNTLAIAQNIEDIQDLLATAKDQEQLAIISVASKQDIIDTLLRAAKQISAGDSAELELFTTLKTFLASNETRDRFLALEGPSQIIKTFTAHAQGKNKLCSTLLDILTAAATKSEDNKQNIMDLEITYILSELLVGHKEPEIVKAVSRLIIKLTTADDSRPVVSRAFQNSRSLAKSGLHLEFLNILKLSHEAGKSAACCQALKKLCVNDELCREAVDVGAVEDAMKCLEENASSVAVVKSTFSFLRQLAGNDDVKQQFSDAGWLQIVKQAISNHIESPGSMEQALGFITAICLRNPEVASAVLHSGLPEIVLEIMNQSDNQWVQRQACMAVRNLASRNLENRPILLKMGFQEALEDAKKTHPKACADVGSAALRDLGIDNYNS